MCWHFRQAVPTCSISSLWHSGGKIRIFVSGAQIFCLRGSILPNSNIPAHRKTAADAGGASRQTSPPVTRNPPPHIGSGNKIAGIDDRIAARQIMRGIQMAPRHRPVFSQNDSFGHEGAKEIQRMTGRTKELKRPPIQRAHAGGMGGKGRNHRGSCGPDRPASLATAS